MSESMIVPNMQGTDINTAPIATPIITLYATPQAGRGSQPVAIAAPACGTNGAMTVELPKNAVLFMAVVGIILLGAIAGIIIYEKCWKRYG